MGDNGRLLIGDNGFILGTRLYPESRRKDFPQPPRTIPRLPPAPKRGQEHYLEWIVACKGGKPAGSNFDWAGPLAEAVLLGNVALRVQLRTLLTRYKLLWDAPHLRFTNLEEANKFIRREYRQGWSL
jgi:hypothetical protein